MVVLSTGGFALPAPLEKKGKALAPLMVAGNKALAAPPGREDAGGKRGGEREKDQVYLAAIPGNKRGKTRR